MTHGAKGLAEDAVNEGIRLGVEVSPLTLDALNRQGQGVVVEKLDARFARYLEVQQFSNQENLGLNDTVGSS